ncbi:MAG TPA: protein kinase, partial [Polyangia bacterium]
DVSPQNVFITYEGVVKVVDFGIAQFVGTHASQPSRNMKGRLAYMAPEQVAGLAVDRRADLFSVGVMLWELAVGRRLWQGMSEADITQHLLARKPLPLLPRNRGLPPGLAAICSRALAPLPEDRYADASTFLSDLSELMTGTIPVHSRLLSDLMGRLFGSSRALTRAMIQQRLQGEGLFPSEEAAHESHESNDRQATGEYPASARSSGKMNAVFDRSTSSAIATAGREITGVNRVPWLWPTRSNGILVTGLGVASFLVLLVLGVTLRDCLSRRAGSAHSPQHTSAAKPVLVAPASALPTHGEKPILPEVPERATPQPPQYTVQEPVIPNARTAQHAKAPPKGAPTPRAMPGARLSERDFFDVGPKGVQPASSRTIEHDFFDVDLKTMHHAPRRVMDREDPYKP